MSNQLLNGQGRDINVFAGQSLAVSSITGAYTATIVSGAGNGTVLAADSTGGATYGPYSGGVTIRLKSGEGGLIDYEAAVSPVLNYAGPARLGYSAAGDTSSVVDAAGIPSAPSFAPLRGFSAATAISEVIFDQSPGGKYLFTAYDAANNYTSSLSIATGPLASLSKTALAVTNVSSLKDTAGAAITAGSILAAWWISETRFMFVGKKNAGVVYFVWICDFNGGSWKVGSNSALFDNGNAVLALGLWSGGQAGGSSILHQRSVAISPTKILLGEYNIATGRVAGGTNDAVRVYQSTDSGATWTALLTFNTSGNQIRHCHFVKYDRYTGEFYIGFGDDPDSALLRWDGTSAAPPANTPLTPAGVTGYPGWEVMHDTLGFECRSGDITIHPQTAYYMADNSEANTPIKYAFHVSKSHPMQRIQSNEYERTIGRSPLIGMELPNGGAFWCCIRETSDAGAAPEPFKGYDFWYTPDGVTFTRIARTRDNSAGINGTISNIFMTTEGKIVISGFNAKGCKLLPVATTNGEGSLVVTPTVWDGTVRTLQGAA